MVIVLLTFKYFTQHVLNDNLMYCDLEGVDNCTSIIYYLLPLLYIKLFRIKGFDGNCSKTINTDIFGKVMRLIDKKIK